MNDGILLELFQAEYDKATAARKKGDTEEAKRRYLRAAQIMDELAQKSLPPLDKTRKERAEKLKFIAENLQNTVEEGTSRDGNGAEEYMFFKPSPPNVVVTFDDIIGLAEANDAIHRLLIDPLNNPEAYSKYGIKAGGFLLLEGPPGTGKTTFAKAAAHELKVPFAEVNANALVDSYIGKTGKNIDRLFAEARKYAKQSGTPVVLFVDELDYLAQKRGGENKTAAEAVPTLIKQMDGFSTDSDNIVLIAATNLKSSLDPAVLGRFASIINIPLPDKEERKQIFAAKLSALDNGDKAELDFEKAAELSNGFSGRDITQAALELKTALAARDAGIKSLDMPLGQKLLSIIEKRKLSKDL